MLPSTRTIRSAASLPATALLAILGVYAILVGLRIFFIKPLPEKESKAHRLWLAPVGLGSGFHAGLISAGSKPFAVPALPNLLLAHFEFVVVTIVALIVNRFRLQNLNKVVNTIIAPIRIIMRIRFRFMAVG